MHVNSDKDNYRDDIYNFFNQARSLTIQLLWKPVGIK